MRLVKKRTTKLTEDQTKSLLQLIEQSIKADTRYFDTCHQLRELLRGKHWNKISTKQQKEIRVTVNLIHSQVRSLVPTLFFQDPYVIAKANNILQKDRAPVWEGLINTVLEQVDFKNVIKQVVLDAVIYPEGVCKWVVTKEADNEGIESGETPLEGDDSQAGSLAESGASGPPSWFAEGTPVPVRVSPLQTIVDYASPNRSLGEARFVAFRYRKLVSELKADPRYNLGDDFRAGGATPAAESSLGREREAVVDFWDDGLERANGNEFVTLYEVWVYQLVDYNLYKQVVYLVEGYDKPVRGPVPWSDFTGPHCKTYPIQRLVFDEIPDDLPVGEVAIWQSLQGTLNWLMSKLVSFVKNEKQLYEFDPKKAVKADKAKASFYSGISPELIETLEPGCMTPIPVNRPSSDNYQLIQMILQGIQMTSGLGVNRRGLTGARTATEASLVEQGTQIKTDEKADIVAEFCKANVRVLVAMLRSTVKPDFVFRVTGQVGGVQWMKFTQADADWSPDLSIRVNSFRKNVEQDRMAKLMQLFQMGLPLVQLYGPQIKLDLLYGLIIKEADIPYAEQIAQSVVPEEVTQMVEIMRMMVGEPTQVNAADNHTEHRRVIANLKNSSTYQLMTPQAKIAIDEHDMGHAQYEEQMASSSGGSMKAPATSAPFDGQDNSTPQSVANGETSGDRNTAYPVGGRAL